MIGEDPDAEKNKQKKRSKQDLNLNHVEALKDKLYKHLKEIKKLHAYNFTKNDDVL